jgi:hypothetical protein
MRCPLFGRYEEQSGRDADICALEKCLFYPLSASLRFHTAKAQSRDMCANPVSVGSRIEAVGRAVGLTVAVE